MSVASPTVGSTLAPETARWSSADLARLSAWLDIGQAHRVLPELERLRAWQLADPEAGLVLVRLLRQIGADRSAEALVLALGRRHPGHAEALIGLLRGVLWTAGGIYRYWRLTQRLALPPDATPSNRAGWLSLRALWLAEVRDDQAAQATHREALALDPQDPWLHVEHSYGLVRLDRHEAALDAARQAVQQCPGHRTGTLQTARVLQIMGRRDEAQAVLEAALAQVDSAAYAWSLLGLAQDAQDHERVLLLADRTEAALPLADRGWRDALAARRADALLSLGRIEAAREQAARVSGSGFYPRMATRLAELDAATIAAHRATLIPLSMVTQHWMTCAPATLTALANHWGRPADHLEVAQAICYDGTPQASEREWAHSQGFWVRECRLDWTTACALLEAGVPFALATHHVGSGHLQAVVGCDPLRRTLLIRDPSMPLHAEYAADALFDSQQASGPRAMVMLPPDQLHRIQGIELPQAAQWDLGHAVLAALQRHDRAAAAQALDTLHQEAPDSDSTLRAQRHIALYDGDEVRILAATEALLARYPQDASLQLSRISSLLEVRGQAAGEAYMAELVAQPWPDPLLLARWAGRLALDGRRLPEAFAVIRRALRRDGRCSRAWSELADLLWSTEGSATGAALATEPARLASTLAPTDEWLAATFARTCRVAGQPETGLAWLREREQAWGDRSSQPALTLVDELDLQQRDAEAEATLAQALHRRPDDTALRLAMAERALHAHRLDEAQALLDGCTEVRAPSLLRLRALIAESHGQLAQALEPAEQSVTLEPLNLSLHRLLLRLLRRRYGNDEALARWRPHADAYPAHVGLHKLLYEALPDEPGAITAQLAHMQAWHPDLPWLQRERAVQASRQGRHDEAVALAGVAVAQAAQSAVALDVMGYCVLRRDGYRAALPWVQDALRRDAELDTALNRLMQAPDPELLAQGTAFVAEQLRQQPLMGDGLLHFQAVAGRGWSAEDVLALLQELHGRWPWLWQAPLAVALQLMQLQRVDDAFGVLDRAVMRFPQVARLHVERAQALRLIGRIDEAVQANAPALATAPGWNRAVRLQVDLLCKHGLRWSEAEALLQRALQTREGWNDADLMGLLAWVHEHQDRGADALAMARRALCLDPAMSWVWSVVRRVCGAAETPEVLDAVLDEVVASRPGDVAAWVVRAEQVVDDQAGLHAAEQALALDPRLEVAWQARFERLLRLGRLDEIRAGLQQLPWPDGPPMSLRAWGPRVAWEAAEHDEAIRAMRALCALAPHDENLRARLADWLDHRGHDEAYLEQAEALVAMAPLEARSHGYRGHALVKLRRWTQALPPLQRALELAPGYVFAARQLLVAAQESSAWDAAEAALQALWPHAPDVNTASDGLLMAARAGRQDLALAWLQRLFEADGFDIDGTRQALNACREAGWADVLEPLQRAQLARGGGPVGLALDWFDREATRTAWLGGFLSSRAVMRQALELQRSATGPFLLIGLMRWLAARDQAWLLKQLLRSCDAALRAHPSSWGEASFALISLNHFSDVIAWLHDWRTRDKVPIFALANLAGSLAVLQRWKELEAVVLAVLRRMPDQEDARLWQLLLHARAGDLPALQAALDRRHEWAADPWMRPPLKAVEVFVSLAQARGGQGTIAALRAATPDGGPEQAWALWRELRRLALQRHTAWTRLAGWYNPF